jgi:soluble lytic murein transglycosylase-like protein
LPTTAEGIARDLTKTTTRLNHLIAAWRAAGGSQADSRSVALTALHQQRLYRSLLPDEGLSRRVLAKLPPALVWTAKKNLRAGRDLRSLVDPPKRLPHYILRRPKPASKLLGYYRAAGRRFNIPWHILAGLNFVESKFGRILGPSSAGALGPMQFMPATWKIYGHGGDVMDPHDAIVGAARYLSASGAPHNMNGALYAYNHSDRYVDAVRTYAGRMGRNRRNFFSYYFWQVFAITQKGDVQLTGPGS